MANVIPINRALANALNIFIGKKVVYDKHVGRAFYRGIAGDGTVELATLPGVNDGAPSDTITITTAGRWNTTFFTGGPCQFDKERFLGVVGALSPETTVSARFNFYQSDTIDPHVATVVIALLFGRDEVGRPLTTDETKLLSSSAAQAVAIARQSAEKSVTK